LAGTLGLVSLLAAAAAAPARPPSQAGPWVWHAQPRTAPIAGAAAIRRTTWLPRFRITEYYPAPEAWAVGAPVTAPGLRARHRIDWLYSGLGLSMEGTGIGLDGRLYHIDNLGRGGWVTRAGKLTFDGVHDNGPPYWRRGGYWKNRGRYVPPPAGISFAPGAGTPGLRYWRTIAVDPSLIPLGSRVYIPYYRGVKGATGWFVANDTGGAINGRHIDVYRPPPRTIDEPARFLRGQRVLIVRPVAARGRHGRWRLGWRRVGRIRRRLVGRRVVRRHVRGRTFGLRRDRVRLVDQ
jgi:3D (Asp-Asp-Asp) domain-containing protein